MNRKAIKSILAKTHRKFVESIKDDVVKELVNKNSIITGGAITSLLTDEEVNDYDYYFTNKETCLAVANYYAKQFNDTHKGKKQVNVRDDEFGRITCFISSSGEVGDDEDIKNSAPDESDEEDLHKAIYFTSNAITLSGNIQLVIRFYGDPAEIHKNYDFVHCTNYWLSSDRDLHLNIGALESILAKELLYQGSKYPLCSIIRTRKFIKRGWSINAGQYVKMAMQLNDLDLKNIEVLKEQLTGVDSSYFDMFISAIQHRQDDDPGFELNAMVVSELIDKIFFKIERKTHETIRNKRQNI